MIYIINVFSPNKTCLIFLSIKQKLNDISIAQYFSTNRYQQFIYDCVRIYFIYIYIYIYAQFHPFWSILLLLNRLFKRNVCWKKKRAARKDITENIACVFSITSYLYRTKTKRWLKLSVLRNICALLPWYSFLCNNSCLWFFALYCFWKRVR